MILAIIAIKYLPVGINNFYSIKNKVFLYFNLDVIRDYCDT